MLVVCVFRKTVSASRPREQVAGSPNERYTFPPQTAEFGKPYRRCTIAESVAGGGPALFPAQPRSGKGSTTEYAAKWGRSERDHFQSGEIIRTAKMMQASGHTPVCLPSVQLLPLR